MLLAQTNATHLVDGHYKVATVDGERVILAEAEGAPPLGRLRSCATRSSSSAHPDIRSTASSPARQLRHSVLLFRRQHLRPRRPPRSGTGRDRLRGERRHVRSHRQGRQPTEYRGAWTYWAFTKDVAAQRMCIYRNGVLRHADVGRGRPLLMTPWSQRQRSSQVSALSPPPSGPPPKTTRASSKDAIVPDTRADGLFATTSSRQCSPL